LTVVFKDIDDQYEEFKNRSEKVGLRLYDDSIRVPRIVYDDKATRSGQGRQAITSISTATTSESVGSMVTAYLGGTTAAVQGSVLVATTPASGYGHAVCISNATNDLTSWVGIAAEAASVGDVIQYYTDGYVLARTTGTVAVGNTLVTSSDAAGHLKADATPTTGADVGVALAVGTAAGGLTKIRLGR
jgi:hypothetical protein